LAGIEVGEKVRIGPHLKPPFFVLCQFKSLETTEQ
jgi:hypothetical protein